MIANELIVDVLSRYELGEITGVESVHGGRNVPVLLVRTRCGRFIVRRLAEGDAERISRRHGLLGSLRQRGLPVRSPLQTTNGDTVVAADGALHEVFPYVEGRTFRRGDSQHVAAAADALAQYHEIVRAFPTAGWETLGYVAGLIDDLTAFSAAAAQTGLTTGILEDESARVLVALPERAAAFADRLREQRGDELPTLLIHGDYRRSNLLFKGDRLVAILDFDRASVDARVVDVAMAISNLCRGTDKAVLLEPGLTRRLMAGYLAGERLTTAEVAALPLLIEAKQTSAAIRRFRRWEQAPTPEREKRARKLRKHLGRVRRLAEHQSEWTGAIREL